MINQSRHATTAHSYKITRERQGDRKTERQRDRETESGTDEGGQKRGTEGDRRVSKEDGSACRNFVSNVRRSDSSKGRFNCTCSSKVGEKNDKL